MLAYQKPELHGRGGVGELEHPPTRDTEQHTVLILSEGTVVVHGHAFPVLDVVGTTGVERDCDHCLIKQRTVSPSEAHDFRKLSWMADERGGARGHEFERSGVGVQGADGPVILGRHREGDAGVHGQQGRSRIAHGSFTTGKLQPRAMFSFQPTA